MAQTPKPMPDLELWVYTELFRVVYEHFGRDRVVPWAPLGGALATALRYLEGRVQVSDGDGHIEPLRLPIGLVGAVGSGKSLAIEGGPDMIRSDLHEDDFSVGPTLCSIVREKSAHDDCTGGKPHRWVWFPTYTIPTERELTYEEFLMLRDQPLSHLDWELRGLIERPKLMGTEMLDHRPFPVIEAGHPQREAAGAGEVAECRLRHARKLAAIIALTDHREQVIEGDWRAAERIMQVSDEARRTYEQGTVAELIPAVDRSERIPAARGLYRG